MRVDTWGPWGSIVGLQRRGVMLGLAVKEGWGHGIRFSIGLRRRVVMLGLSVKEGWGHGIRFVVGVAVGLRHGWVGKGGCGCVSIIVSILIIFIQVIVGEGGDSVRLELPKLVVVRCKHVRREVGRLVSMPGVWHHTVQAGGVPRLGQMGGKDLGECPPLLISARTELDVR